MGILASISSNYRYATGLRRFLSTPLTLEETRRGAEENLANRSINFLRLIETAVYNRPTSPYARLLMHAGIAFGDICSLIDEVGLEGTLERLYDAGVYVTQEELKGRQPVRRGSLEFETKAPDFDSPFVKELMARSSSGRSGRPTRTQFDFGYLEYQARSYLLTRYTHVPGRVLGRWSVGEPSSLLMWAKSGEKLERLFSTRRSTWSTETLRTVSLEAFTRGASHLFGMPLARAVHLERDDALPVARWIAMTKASGKPVGFFCSPSLAVKVCMAANENGLDISGTRFLGGGEPFTAGKAEVLAGVGAEGRVSYAMREAGRVGESCGNLLEPGEVHLIAERLALITRDKNYGAASVPGFVFTSLLPDMPKVLINAESGDYGRVYERECGCLMHDIGYRVHMSEIRSAEKLTSEGVTFMSSRLIHLVEEVLPGRYGGTVNSYQLVEEEDDGVSRVSIIVSPTVGAVNEADLIHTVMQNLRETHEQGGELMTEQWRQANTLRLVRREPYVTSGRKVLPLHVIRS